MKKFTKFSLAAVAVLGLSNGAYAVTNVDNGIGGTSTSLGLADTLTITATAGTFISDDVTVGGTMYGTLSPNSSLNLNDTTGGWQNSNLSAEDDIILNADSPDGGYGGVLLQKNAVTLMSVGEGYGTDVNIYTDTYMNDNQIHGLAPGTLGTDAANMNQLNGVENDMSKGVAAATALANIPQVDQGKTYSLGIGYGHYNGENALAVGGSWRYNTDGIVKASLGTGGSGAVVGIGTAMSW